MNSSSAWGTICYDQFLGDKFPSGDDGVVHGVGLIQFTDDAACIRGACGLECLEGIVLCFLEVGAYFVVVGCHLGRSLSVVLI